MKSKFIQIFLLILIIGLIIIPSIEASFWNNLFLKKVTTTTEKNVVKKELSSVKTLNKESQVTKGLAKTERMEISFANGLKWEKVVKDYFCKSKINCFKTANEMVDNKRGYGIYKFYHKSDFTIIDDIASRDYIKNHIDPTFTKKPDILNVYGEELYGKPKKIEIVDAKLSPNAVRSEQDLAFKDLCIKAERKGIECSVIYAEPKSNLKEGVNALCTVSILIPDPYTTVTDALCLITAFS